MQTQGVQIRYKADLAECPGAKLRVLKSKKKCFVTDEEYADGTVTAERNFENFHQSGREMRLSETEWMRIPTHMNDTKQELKIRNAVLKESNSFVYLGRTLANSTNGYYGEQ